MYAYKRILYGLTLFLACAGLMLGNRAFGEDCRGKVVSDPNLKAAGHRYTCEFTDDATEERLYAYCQRATNTVSTWVDSTCPAAGKSQLKCHICSCAGTWKDGKCQNQAIAPINGTLPPGGGTTPPSGLGTTSPGVTTPPPGGNTQGTNGTPPANSGNTQNAASCADGITDSQGKCCKKTYYDVKLEQKACCEGMLLATNVPFIGQCIVYKKIGAPDPSAGLVIDQNSAFPVLIGGLNRLMVSLILLVSFMGILVAGVMIAASGASTSDGKKIIGNIISALALLGASGVILHLINPQFFG